MTKQIKISRIALSQRVDVVPDYGERRDGIDQAWVGLLQKVDPTFLPVGLLNGMADPAAYINALAPDAVILTGGNDLASLPQADNSAPERDALEIACLDYCRARQKPLLAVCRGFQAMNVFLGGSLSRVNGHVGTVHEVVSAEPDPGHSERSFEVNSFHTFAINEADLAGELDTMYRCGDGTIEAARHSVLPWLGIMWHPERPGPDAAARLDFVAGFFADILRP